MHEPPDRILEAPRECFETDAERVALATPSSLAEALAFRAASGAVPLAGGTDLMVAINARRAAPEQLLALRRINELQGLGPDRIGAGVTWRRLLDCSDRALAQAARTVGSPQIRAAGTIGGNVATASPAGDALPVLAALDARLEVMSRDRPPRTLRWDEFFRGPKQTAMLDDELLTAILLPEDRPVRSCFAKVGVRGAMVIAMVNACVTRADDGRITVALGAVGPTVVRAREAERLVCHRSTLSRAERNEFVRRVRADISPITDHRASDEYRTHAAGVLALRLLERVMSA